MKLLASIAALLCACAEPPAPRLNVMVPGEGLRATPTEVSIRGEHLYPGVDDRYDGEEAVSTTFAARLGDTALERVEWISERELAAVVPAGIAPGTHDLVVELPDGTSLELSRAFTVRAPAGPVGAVEILSAIPDELTADGVDWATIRVRVLNPEGEPLSGQLVTSSPTSGTTGTAVDLGNGDYELRYTAPTAPGSGVAVLTATCEGVSATRTLRLMPSCAGADAEVASGAALLAAIAAANAGTGARDVCITSGTTINLTQTLVLTNADGITLRGEARTTLSGVGLPAEEHGLELASGNNAIRDLTFVSFADSAVELDGSGNTVAGSRFVNCDRALGVRGSDNIIGPGNEISGAAERAIEIEGAGTLVFDNYLHDGPGSAGIDLGVGETPAEVWVRRNLFLRLRAAIEVDEGNGLRLDGNTIVAMSGPAVSLDAGVTGVLMRNNIFAQNPLGAIAASDASFAAAPAHNLFFASSPACATCTLGVGTLQQDPLFVAADDFRLSQASPCVDAGLAVGYAYSGPSPDLGAFELR